MDEFVIIVNNFCMFVLFLIDFVFVKKNIV